MSGGLIMWTYCLLVDNTCWHACEWQESSQWRRGNRCIRPLQFYTTSAVLAVPCTVPGTLSPLHTPNTSPPISSNVRLFYALTAVVNRHRPWLLQNCCTYDESRTTMTARAVSSVFSHMWYANQSLINQSKTGWSQTYIDPSRQGNIKVNEILC